MPTATRADTRWHAAVEEHQVAVAAYLDTAAALSDDAWARPWAPGKWTRAQVTEHVVLTYRALIAEVVEGTAMRLRMTRLRRAVLRTVLLPHILFHRTFPLKAVSPREVRPSDSGMGREEALRELRALAARFEEEAEKRRIRGGGQVTHPYFGAVDLTRGMRFCAVHLEHHRRQIASAG